MGYTINYGGKDVTFSQWARAMDKDERNALIAALKPYAKPEQPTTSREVMAAMTALPIKEKSAFIATLKEGIAVAETALEEEEFDKALERAAKKINKQRGYEVDEDDEDDEGRQYD